MRKTLLCLTLFVSCLLSEVAAQQVTIEGTGSLSSHLYGPMHTQNAAPRSFRGAFIYNESLLTGMIAGSSITELQFSRSNAGPALPAGNNFKVYLMNTTSNTWNTGSLTWDVSGATLVYDGDPAAIVGTTSGYKTFPLSSSFVYQGDNIVLFTEYRQSSAPSTTISWHYNTPATQPAYNAEQVKYALANSATLPSSLSTTSGNHPNMIIGYTPPPPCSAPSAGIATASPVGTVCSGDLVQLRLSGHSIGLGQTYLWQSFTTAGGPYADVSTASASDKLNINPTETRFYRAAVTCGSTTVYSDSVRVDVAALFPQGIYTINSLIATGGTNFNSFTDAVNAIRCGITGPVVFNFNPASGPYVENITIPEIFGASSTNTITFNGNGRTLYYEQSTAGAERTAITLDGADHVTINDLVVDVSVGTYGWGIRLVNNADSNTISNSIIKSSTTDIVNANHAGIILGGTATSPATAGPSGNYNTISGNTITGGYYGIVLTGTSAANTQSLDNKVMNNTVQETYSHSIYASNQSGAVISGNNISRPARTTSTTVGGIYLFTGAINTLVEKNRIHNMFGGMSSNASTFYGIYISAKGIAANPNRIENNLVYNNNHIGPYFGVQNINGDYMHLRHNTIYINDQVLPATGSTYGLFLSGAVPGIDVKNNIIYISRSSTGIKRAIYVTPITAVISVDNNIYFFDYNVPGKDNYFGQWGADAVFENLAEWRTANLNAYDQLSHEVDPLFANPAAGNFTPTEPTIDNVGTPVGVLTDIIGTPRSTTAPDAGAYEFTPPPCTAPPVAGSATATPIGIICPTQQVILSLKNGTLGQGQTYQWQSSSTLGGTYTDMGAVSDYRATVINPTVTMYYRAAVTCGGVTRLSDTIAVQVASLFPGGTYTINSEVSTGGTNFQSFTDAVNAIRCGITGGVTFNVVDTSGPYNEQITIPLIAGASSANPVVFNGNGRTIQYTPNADQRHVILLNGASHITFDSLRVVGLDATYGWGFHLVRNADSNVIKNCTIDMSAVTSTTANNSVGISSTSYTTTYGSGLNASNSLITRNTIIGGHTGIIYFGKKNTISHNTIHDFVATGVMVTASDSVVIAHNNIHRANRIGTLGIFTGIELRAGTKNGRIDANRIHSTHNAAAPQSGSAYGIFSSIDDAPAGQENVISNNIIHNFNSTSGIIYGLYNSTSDGTFYYHNTVVINNPGATSGTTHGFTEQSNLGRTTARTTAHALITFKNNIIYINRGGTGERLALSFLTTPTNITSNNNDLYNVSSETSGNIAKLGSTVYATLAAWKTANGGAFDQQSVSINPAFANAAAFDFTPTAAALDNLGINVGISKDFFGTTRSATTPDMGAIEFDVSLPVTLLSFKGAKQGSINKLEWETATEINNAGFELQRSIDGSAFNKLTFVPSVAVNSTIVNRYHFDDVNPITGVNYYRLKQIDRDGKFTYSNIVRINGGDIKALTLVQAYPNPVKNILNMKIASPKAGKATVMVTDVAGKTYLQQTITLTEGEVLVQLPVSGFATGTYMMKVITSDGESTPAYTFIKQ